MKICYGLIGLGGIARTHLQGLRSLAVLGLDIPPVEFAALMTTDTGKVQLGRSLGFARIEHDLDTFLAGADVDVVDICTPNKLHRQQILAAAKAKKHIYFEKPLSLNGQEARDLGRALAETDLVIQGAYILRFLPAVAMAKAIMAQGILGRIHSFRFVSYHSSYLNPQRPGSWRLQQAMSGGGALMDLGCHLLDLTRFLLGDAAEVKAWTKTVVPRRRWPQGEATVDVDDHALVVLGMENGAQGSVEVSRVAVGGEGMSMEIYGDKGGVHINPARSAPRCFNALGREFTPDLAPDPFLSNLHEVFPPTKLSMGWMVDAHAAGLAWFLRSVANKSVPPGTPDLAEGIKTQLLVEAAYRSLMN